MQTFLPYSDFQECAKCLDMKRLGKQRSEGKQILEALHYIETNDFYKINKKGKRVRRGWLSHPAVLMWKGYEDCLKLYLNIIMIEWADRGYINNMDFWELPEGKIKMPPWLGDEAIHYSQKANLVRKKPDFYSPLWPEIKPMKGYVWPKVT